MYKGNDFFIESEVPRQTDSQTGDETRDIQRAAMHFACKIYANPIKERIILSEGARSVGPVDVPRKQQRRQKWQFLLLIGDGSGAWETLTPPLKMSK